MPKFKILMVLLPVLAVAAPLGCGRLSLRVLGQDEPSPPPTTSVLDAGIEAPMDVSPDLTADMRSDGPVDVVADLAGDLAGNRPVVMAPPAPASPPIPGCQVRGDEMCNGLDDDCNGQVDDRIAPVPCPGGGQRLCVAGRFSECPRRCEVCQPGSRRVCQVAFCDFWGAQSCAADGQSFGSCRESRVPAECADIAKSHKRSSDLERCCIDSGYCCLDEFDLDNDGDRSEMLGRCDSVRCGP